jgi:hypothetical protein
MDPFRRRAITLALNVFAFPAMIRAQTTELDRFVGKDLWKNPPSKREQTHLAELIGKVPKGQMMEPQPWHVWRIQSDGQARYLVLLGEKRDDGPRRIFRTC